MIELALIVAISSIIPSLFFVIAKLDANIFLKFLFKLLSITTLVVDILIILMYYEIIK